MPGLPPVQLLRGDPQRCARYCTNAKNEQEKCSFRSILGLSWVKTTSLSGHHSQFGTAANCNINVKMLLNSLLKMQR